MKISAMVLGEGPYFKYCMESIEDIVDEMVSYGGESDDFSHMRNDCLKRITGDWVLVLDSDEILSNPDGTKIKRKQLEELIKIADERKLSGFHLFTLHFLYNYRTIDGQNNGQHHSYGRFYRRKDIEKYQGKIHELPKFKYGQNLATVRNVWIFHFGHCQGMEHIREKYRRTMEIPGNPFAKEFKGKTVDEYCAGHELFRATRPTIRYDGPLPEVMRLW